MRDVNNQLSKNLDIFSYSPLEGNIRVCKQHIITAANN